MPDPCSWEPPSLWIEVLSHGSVIRWQKPDLKAGREQPPRGSFVTSDGVTLHYVERGSRSPVVFPHGNDVMIDGYSWPASNRHRANSMVIGFHLRGTASVNQQKIAASDLPR